MVQKSPARSGSLDRWFALEVRSRHEKKVTDALRRNGCKGFLPLYRNRRRWSDRSKEIDLPLFPGYTFCQLEPGDRWAIVQIPGVRRIVGFGRQPTPIEDQEIEAIQMIVRCGLAVGPWPRLRTGDRVRLEQGPLRGVEGVLETRRRADRLYVAVPLLRRSISVEIDREWARPLAPVGRFGRTFYRSRLRQGIPPPSPGRRR